MASRYAGSGPGDERGKMKITHVNADAMSKIPALSQAVIVANAKKLVVIGEQNGVDANGVVVGDDLESQTEQAQRNVLEVRRTVGAAQENVVQQTILVAKGQDIRSAYAAAQRVWGAQPLAVTVHVGAGFGISGVLIGSEAVCALGA
jgi:enamine deaminase RidA (YjgF/YER057c/UK114 family)